MVSGDPPKIRRAGAGEDLTPYVDLWNEDYPMSQFDVSQARKQEVPQDAGAEIIRWGAWQGEVLKSYMKVVVSPRESGDSWADLSHASSSGVSARVHQEVLNAVNSDLRERGVSRVHAWVLGGRERDQFWLLNGYRHVISTPILHLSLDCYNAQLGNEALATAATLGITFLTVAECQERGIDWISSAAAVAAHLDSHLGLQDRSVESLVPGYKAFFSDMDPADLKVQLLGFSGKKAVALSNGRPDQKTKGRVIHSICGCRKEFEGTQLHLALQARALEIAIDLGYTEVVVGGEFLPSQVDDWMKLGFEIKSMWRRYRGEM